MPRDRGRGRDVGHRHDDARSARARRDPATKRSKPNGCRQRRGDTVTRRRAACGTAARGRAAALAARGRSWRRPRRASDRDRLRTGRWSPVRVTNDSSWMCRWSITLPCGGRLDMATGTAGNAAAIASARQVRRGGSRCAASSKRRRDDARRTAAAGVWTTPAWAPAAGSCASASAARASGGDAGGEHYADRAPRRDHEPSAPAELLRSGRPAMRTDGSSRFTTRAGLQGRNGGRTNARWRPRSDRRRSTAMGRPGRPSPRCQTADRAGGPSDPGNCGPVRIEQRAPGRIDARLDAACRRLALSMIIPPARTCPTYGPNRAHPPAVVDSR